MVVIGESNCVDMNSYKKELIDRHTCCLCTGLIKLPAVICIECSQCFCRDTCFHHLKPKGNAKHKKCTTKCKEKLNINANVSLYIRDRLKELEFKCSEPGCQDHKFTYEKY